eukprot:1160213-Pelagomonas_calceolata.AAC.1
MQEKHNMRTMLGKCPDVSSLLRAGVCMDLATDTYRLRGKEGCPGKACLGRALDVMKRTGTVLNLDRAVHQECK